MLDEFQLRACEGKTKHACRKAAERELKSVLRHNSGKKAKGRVCGGLILNVYCCQFCSHWHIGNKAR